MNIYKIFVFFNFRGLALTLKNSSLFLEDKDNHNDNDNDGSGLPRINSISFDSSSVMSAQDQLEVCFILSWVKSAWVTSAHFELHWVISICFVSPSHWVKPVSLATGWVKTARLCSTRIMSSRVDSISFVSYWIKSARLGLDYSTRLVSSLRTLRIPVLTIYSLFQITFGGPYEKA